MNNNLDSWFDEDLSVCWDKLLLRAYCSLPAILGHKTDGELLLKCLSVFPPIFGLPSLSVPTQFPAASLLLGSSQGIMQPPFGMTIEMGGKKQAITLYSHGC